MYAPPSLGDSGPERVTEIRSWATTTTEARVSRGEEDYAPKGLSGNKSINFWEPGCSSNRRGTRLS